VEFFTGGLFMSIGGGFSMGNRGENKRMFQRYACSLDSEVLMPNGSSRIGKVMDISMLGAGVVMSKPVEFGTRVNIKATNKDQESFNLKGIVRWCKEFPEGWFSGVELDKPFTRPLELLN